MEEWLLDALEFIFEGLVVLIGAAILIIFALILLKWIVLPFAVWLFPNFFIALEAHRGC